MRIDPVRGKQAVGNETGDAIAVTLQILDLRLHLGGHLRAERGGIAAVAVGGRHPPHKGPERRLRPQRGRIARGQKGIPVIGLGGHDHPAFAGFLHRDAGGQIIGLRAGAGEHHVAAVGDAAAKTRQHRFGQLQDFFLHIAGMGAQDGHLPRHRLDNARMPMPERGHIVIGIEIIVAVGIKQQCPFAPRDRQRLAVKQPVGGAEQPCPPRDPPRQHRVERCRGCRVKTVDHGSGTGFRLAVVQCHAGLRDKVSGPRRCSISRGSRARNQSSCAQLGPALRRI